MAGLAQAMVFLIPVAGAISLFTFLAVASWAENRRRERESYYRYEFRKRLVEAGKLDASELDRLIRSEAEMAAGQHRQRLLVAGMVLVGAGAGLLLGLRFIEGEAVWMVGFIPLAIGVAMLTASWLAPTMSGKPSGHAN